MKKEILSRLPEIKNCLTMDYLKRWCQTFIGVWRTEMVHLWMPIFSERLNLITLSPFPALQWYCSMLAFKHINAPCWGLVSFYSFIELAYHLSKGLPLRISNSRQVHMGRGGLSETRLGPLHVFIWFIEPVFIPEILMRAGCRTLLALNLIT